MGKISILGMYLHDNTIFDVSNFPIPTVVVGQNPQPVFDRDVFSASLLIECAELDLVYHNYDFFKVHFKNWALKNAPKWKKLYKASIAEFDPTENYNRYEESNFQHGKAEQHSGGTHSVSDGSTTNNGSDSVSHKVVGMNVTADKEAYKDVTLLGSGNTVHGDVTNTDTLRIENSGTDINTSHIHGNIGVTTTTAMLAEYREYASHIVIDDVIADFKKDFCVMIY